MKVRLDDVAVVVGADATAADHLEAVLSQKFFSIKWPKSVLLYMSASHCLFIITLEQRAQTD